MNAPETKQTSCPEGTYRPGNDPQCRSLARQVFLLSIIPAAVPVLVAAGMMLQAQHKGARPSAVAISPQQNGLHAPVKAVAAPAVAPGGEFAANNPQPATASPSSPIQLSTFESRSKHSEILPDSSARLDYGIVRLETRPPAEDILDRDLLLSPAPDTDSATRPVANEERAAMTVDENSTEARTAGLSAAQVKKMRAEIRTHAIARHHHRPQRHVPPSLFAKIGHSIKEALSMR